MIRSQIDTNVYEGFGGRQTTIGDAVAAVKGIQSIVGTARQQRRQEELEADDAYINDVYARNFFGWDGIGQQDLMKRNRNAMNEISRKRPDLYLKSLEFFRTIGNAMRKNWRRTIPRRETLYPKADPFMDPYIWPNSRKPNNRFYI
ncbi:MAG: hypothetical protein JW913_19640 [Chitinispirillaceae bacterium]|nr:hypothetical protein [Chitinispirillaceae bacterium]